MPGSINKKESAGMGNEKNSTESTVDNTDSYLQGLIVTNPLQEPIFRRAIHALDLPPGSQGLDVGCGTGLQTIMLAEAVEPADMSQALIYPRNSWLMRETLQRRRASLSRSPFRRGT